MERCRGFLGAQRGEEMIKTFVSGATTGRSAARFVLQPERRTREESARIGERGDGAVSEAKEEESARGIGRDQGEKEEQQKTTVDETRRVVPSSLWPLFTAEFPPPCKSSKYKGDY